MLTFKRADAHPDSPDSQWIWQWRNDPVTREMSITTEVIPWENHKTWYARAARDLNKVLLLARDGDTPTGMVRFDLRTAAGLKPGDETAPRAEAEISINLNPELRGRGLGTPLLAAGCAWGFRELELDRIHARIKPTNLRSSKIFARAGFVFIEEQAGYRVYHVTPEGLLAAPEIPRQALAFPPSSPS